MANKIKEEICCPKFDPKPWDNKIVNWKNKKFIKEKVFTLFYMPINFGLVMERAGRMIETSKGKLLEGMALSEQKSLWNMDLYLAVDKEIPGAENVTISGKFDSKVYEGEFKNTGEWIKDFEKETGKTMVYAWYTTCPKCAKKYGKNYVVLFGKS